jgi:hypothetical protein
MRWRQSSLQYNFFFNDNLNNPHHPKSKIPIPIIIGTNFRIPNSKNSDPDNYRDEHPKSEIISPSPPASRAHFLNIFPRT